MAELVVVTGGAGFIGSHLVERLCVKGFRVRIIDDFSAGKQENLQNVAPDLMESIHGSVQDANLLSRAFRGAHSVVHLAGRASVEESFLRPEAVHESNVSGTFHILSQAHRCGVNQVLFASSSAVYGEQVASPITEETAVRPLSPYGWSKAIGELYCESFRQTYRQKIVAIRCFNIFGPRQYPARLGAGVIPRFLHSLLQGKAVSVIGDGFQTRDFLFVADAAEAFLRAISADLGNTSVLNVASGRSTSIRELIPLLAKATGQTPEVTFEAARQGEIRHSSADICRSLATLGDYRATELVEGVRLTWEWIKSTDIGH